MMTSKYYVFPVLIWLLAAAITDVTAQTCSNSPCTNGATCTNVGSGYSCACAAGFTGTQCETNVDECASDPCQNGATCTDGINTYSCSCPPGYTAAQCQTDINECQSSPCQNGATCSNALNAYSCNCVAGYSSANCETNIDECQSSPCQNGATCADQVNGYSCACASLYSGSDCQTFDACLSNPCQNGATCRTLTSGFECVCVEPFLNTLCQTEGKTQSFAQETRVPVDYDNDLNDPATPTFQNTSKVFCDAIKAGYKSTRPNEEVGCTVTGYAEGSVIVKYFVTFTTPTSAPTLTIAEVQSSFNTTAADLAGAQSSQSLGLAGSGSVTVANIAAAFQAAAMGSSGGGIFTNDNVTFTVSDLDECATATDNTCDTNAGCTNTLGSYTCSCNTGFLDKSEGTLTGRTCLFVGQRLEFWMIILITLGVVAAIVIITGISCQVAIQYRRNRAEQAERLAARRYPEEDDYIHSGYFGRQQAPFLIPSKRIWRSAESTGMGSDDRSDSSSFTLEYRHPRGAQTHTHTGPYASEYLYDYSNMDSWNWMQSDAARPYFIQYPGQ